MPPLCNLDSIGTFYDSTSTEHLTLNEGDLYHTGMHRPLIYSLKDIHPMMEHEEEEGLTEKMAITFKLN